MLSKIIRVLALSILSASMSAHAATPASDDSYAKFVLSARIGPRICSLTVEEAIQGAKLHKTIGSFGKPSSYLPLEVDYQKAKECLSEKGKRLKVVFTEVKKLARTNPVLIKVIDQLNTASFRALLAAIPSGSETESSYEIRMRESQQELRELGDKVIASSCKDDIDCVLVRSEELTIP